MMCDNCKNWAATTDAQLLNRVSNMIHGGPDTHVHRCPKCGGFEWATTDVMIKPKSRTNTWMAIILIIILVAFLFEIAWWVLHHR